MLKFIENNWKAMLSGSVVAIGILIVATVWLYRLAFEKMPEIEDRANVLEMRQIENIEKIYEKLNRQLDEAKTQNDKKIERIEISLAAIKANLISLRSELGKVPSEATLRELIANVSEISNKKASLFSEARLVKGSSQGNQDSPFVNWTQVAKELNVNLDKETAEKGTSDKKNIQVLMTQGIVESSALWKVEDNKLVVHSKDSTIIYTPKQNMSVEELNEHARELNGIKDLGLKSWLKPQSSYQ